MSSDYPHMDGENCVRRAIEQLPAEERYRARRYLEELREQAEKYKFMKKRGKLVLRFREWASRAQKILDDD